jgi:hypothetical protein
MRLGFPCSHVAIGMFDQSVPVRVADDAGLATLTVVAASSGEFHGHIPW